MVGGRRPDHVVPGHAFESGVRDKLARRSRTVEALIEGMKMGDVRSFDWTNKGSAFRFRDARWIQLASALVLGQSIHGTILLGRDIQNKAVTLPKINLPGHGTVVSRE